MINSAKNNLITNINSSLPNMSNTITGWFLNITFEVVERVLEGADWIETTTQTINTKGVVQPASKEILDILPIGAFSWQALLIHCLPDVKLNTNQYIIYDNITYKVMKKADYSKYGYCSYVLLEAYQADNL